MTLCYRSGLPSIADRSADAVGWQLSAIAQSRCARRFIFLCTAAAIALVVSVISDAVVTLLRLPKVDLSLEFLIPALSMLCEILGAGLLVCQIRATAHRAAIARSMLEAV